eukprot:929800-Pyramimonas_sp.AAC.1
MFTIISIPYTEILYHAEYTILSTPYRWKRARAAASAMPPNTRGVRLAKNTTDALLPRPCRASAAAAASAVNPCGSATSAPSCRARGGQEVVRRWSGGGQEGVRRGSGGDLS